MSNSVDNRVVSMEFDNAKFERNVSQSLETLKHLDKSLDGLTNSSKRFDGVSFEDVANQISSLANRFTLGGRIIQKVFDEIAEGVVNVGKKMLNFSTDNMTAGWDKYAEKTTSVQTIMSATGQSIDYVSEQLERLNRFTDETSYSFTDMTSNIAKFTSQGIDLDVAVTQMQGIATWAASAGQNAQAASRAMYNISQAMGAGSMKLIDWKSIQNANMATKEFKEQAIAAGIAAKTLVEQEGKIVTAEDQIEVSTRNFEQTLQKGWFNTEAMQKVFSDYGKFADVVDTVSVSTGLTVTELMQLAEAQATASDSFENDLAVAAKKANIDVEALRAEISKLNAEELKFSKATYKAAQEAKTFGDAVDATKDAVSTAWMNLFETIFGNYDKARVLWTDMANWFYDIFAEPINAVQEFFDGIMNGSDKADDSLDFSGKKVEEYSDIVVAALKKSGVLTDEMIKDAGSVAAAISKITEGASKVKAVVDEWLGGNTDGTEKATDSLERYKEVARDVLNGKYGNGTERKNALEEAGFDYDTVQYMAYKMHEGIGIVEGDLWRLDEKASKLSEEEIEDLKKLRAEIDKGADAVEDLTDNLSKRTGRELLFGKGEDFQGALYDIMDIFDRISTIISEAWNEIFTGDKAQMVKNALVSIKTFTQNVLDGLAEGEKGADRFSRTFKGLFAAIDIVKNAASAFIRTIKGVISALWPADLSIGETIATIGDWIVKLDELIKKNQIFEKVSQSIINAAKKIKSALSQAWKDVFGKSFSESVKSTIKSLGTFLKNLKKVSTESSTFKKVAKGAFTVLKAGKTVLKTAVTGFLGLLKAILPANFSLESMIEKIGSWFTGVSKAIKENNTLTKVFNGLVKAVTTVKTVFSGFKTFIVSVFEKVGSAIKPAIETIKTAFSSLKEHFGPIKEKFGELMQTLKDTGIIDSAGSAISSGLNTALEVAVGLIEKVVELIPSLIDGINKFLTANLPVYIYAIRQAFHSWNLNQIFGGMDNIRSGLHDFIKIFGDFVTSRDGDKFLRDLEERFGKLIDKAKEFGNVIKTMFSGVDSNKLAGLGGLLGGILTFLGIMEALKRFASLKVAVIGTFNALTGAIRAFTANMKYNYVLKIAAAIIILVGALILLSTIPKDQLKAAADALFEIIAALAIVSAVIGIFSNLPGAKNMGAIALAMGAFSVGVLALVVALKLIADTDWGTYLDSLLKLMGLMMTLALVFAMLSKVGMESVGGAAGMIAFALAVLIIVLSLKKIEENAQLLSPDAYVKLIEIFGLIALMSIAMRGVKLTSALGLLLFAVSLVIIEKALLKAMENAIPFDEFKKHWKEFLAILAMLAGIALVTRLGGSGSIKAVLMMLAVIGAMYLVAGAIERLGKIPANQLWPGVGAMVAVGAVFAAILYAAGKLSGATVATVSTITAITVAIGVLLAALIVLTMIAKDNFGSMLKALGAMVVVMGALAGIFIALSYAAKNKVPFSVVLSLIGMIIIVGGILAAITYLTKTGVDTNAILNTCLSLGVVMLALSAAMVIISKAKFDNLSLVNASNALIMMVAVLAPALFALKSLKGVEASLTTVFALTILIEALAGAALLLSLSKSTWQQSLANGFLVIALAGALWLIAKSMQQLNSVNVDGIIEKVTAMSILIGSLSLVTIALSKIPKTASFMGMLKGLGIILLALIGLEALFIATGAAVNKWEWFGKALGDGAEALGSAIGRFVGGLFTGGLISGAIEASTSLALFTESLEPFLDQVQRIDSSAVAGIGSLTKLLLALAADSLVSAITSVFAPTGWIATKLSGVSPMGKLILFADGIKDFINSLRGLTPEEINMAATLMTAVTGMVNALPKEGGLLEAFTGSKSQAMENLGKLLEGFGEAVVKFGEKASEITPEMVANINNAIPAIEAINKIHDGLSKAGGWKETFLGHADTTFVTNLYGLAIAIIAGANTFKQLTSDHVQALENGANAIDSIGKMGKALSVFKTGGLISTVTGKIDLSFIDGLSDIATTIKTAANSFSLLTEDQIAALERGASAAAPLKSIGAALKTFKVDADIPTVIENIRKIIPLGQTIGVLANSFSQILDDQLSHLNNGRTAVETIASIIKSVNGNSFKTENMDSTSSALEKLGPALKTFSEDFSTIKTEGMQEKVNALSTMMTTLTNLGNSQQTLLNTYDISAFSDAFTSAATAVETALTNIVNSINTHTTSIKTSGETLASSFSSGINSGHWNGGNYIGKCCKNNTRRSGY